MTDINAEAKPAKIRKINQNKESRRKMKRKVGEVRDDPNSETEPIKKKRSKTGVLDAPVTELKKVKKRRAEEALDAPAVAKPEHNVESEREAKPTAAVLANGAKEAKVKGECLESPAKERKAQGSEVTADLDREKRGKKRRRCPFSFPPGPQTPTWAFPPAYFVEPDLRHWLFAVLVNVELFGWIPSRAKVSR